MLLLGVFSCPLGQFLRIATLERVQSYCVARGLFLVGGFFFKSCLLVKENNILHIFTYHRVDLSSLHLVTNHFTKLIHLSAHFLSRLLLVQTEASQTAPTLTVRQHKKKGMCRAKQPLVKKGKTSFCAHLGRKLEPEPP